MTAGQHLDVFTNIANNAYQEIRAASANEKRMLYNLQPGGAWKLWKRNSSTTASRTLVGKGNKGDIIAYNPGIQLAYTTYYELQNVSGAEVYQGYSYVILE